MRFTFQENNNLEWSITHGVRGTIICVILGSETQVRTVITVNMSSVHPVWMQMRKSKTEIKVIGSGMFCVG